LGLAPGSDGTTLLARACDDAAFDGPALRRAATALLASDAPSDRRRGDKIAAWLADPTRRAVGFDDYADAFVTREGTMRVTLATRSVADAAPAVQASLAGEARRILAVLKERGACALLQASLALIRLAEALLAEYEARKALHARLDYDDLILKTRALLQRPGV